LRLHATPARQQRLAVLNALVLTRHGGLFDTHTQKKRVLKTRMEKIFPKMARATMMYM
jgi:hypothetical protein